jgi:PBP1b-binding outer membrane lipoprotein LpoB
MKFLFSILICSFLISGCLNATKEEAADIYQKQSTPDILQIRSRNNVEKEIRWLDTEIQKSTLKNQYSR